MPGLSRRGGLNFPVITRLDAESHTKLCWLSSRRQQPMSTLAREALIDYLDHLINAATELGAQYGREREKHLRKTALRTVKRENDEEE